MVTALRISQAPSIIGLAGPSAADPSASPQARIHRTPLWIWPRVNEDQATRTLPMSPNESVESTSDPRDLLERVGVCLPLLADLSRGDVYLYKPRDNPGYATLIGLASPATSGAIRSGIAICEQVSSSD